VRWVATVLATVALAAASVLTADTASAEEGVSRPADGVLRLDGRGYGHGRGLSQWGAYGAASAGVSWQDILAFYYEGTRRVTTASDDPIRVLISADTDGDTKIEGGAGLSVVADGVVTPMVSWPRQWRIIWTGSRLQLQYLDAAGAWQRAGAPEGSSMYFRRSGALIRLIRPDSVRQDLRGTVHAVRYSNATRTYAEMPMDQYLRGVVPAEMPASWPADALRAQTVAARTYAARLRQAATTPWHTCDTTSCQVFRGTGTYRIDGSLITAGEHPSSDAAISATARTILAYGTSSTIPLTEFSAANGGWTAAGSSSQPFLRAKADSWDGRIPNSAHAWQISLDVSRLESKWPSVGRFVRLRINSRTGQGEFGGRITSLTVVGSRGSVTVSGDTFRSAFGLKSTWWHVDAAAHPRDLDGDGRADVLAVERASGALWLYPGGDGDAFASRRQIGSGWTGARDLVTVAGDVTGDGLPDVVAREPSTGALWIYAGDGRGGWRSWWPAGWGWQAMDAIVAPGDFDGDGHADLVARDTSGRLWLYPMREGSFLPRRQIGSGWGARDLVTAVGDWDGDRRPDIVALEPSTGALWLYSGSGSGPFRAWRVIGWGWQAFDRLIGPGDWDEDGLPDLLARRSDGVLLAYRADGRGGFAGSRQIGHTWQIMDPAG
jgi:SpoIID/LytB domain protein